MKLLTFLALPTAILGLTEFKSKAELNLCLNTCNEAILPCALEFKTDCPKVFKKCIDSKDPFTCLSSVNSIHMSKILQCFEDKCKSI